jgi:hypothetical protein
MHIRQAIRDNVKTTLTGLATTGDRVYVNRIYPFIQQVSNGILIYTESESTDYLTMGRPRSQERSLTLKVEIYAKATANLDNSIDDIALEIENALYNDPSRGGVATDTMIMNFDSDFSGDGDSPVGVGILDIVVKYNCVENALGA